LSQHGEIGVLICIKAPFLNRRYRSKQFLSNGSPLNMADRIEITDLADELAEIAKKTRDPETGRLLMELVHRLWTDVGLDAEEGQGGGELPGEPLMEPVHEAA
jgi:hypothetical protein